MTDRAVVGGKVLLLALGNDILGDDGIGLCAARALKDELEGLVDVVETGEAGLALMELMEGYDRAVIVDAIMTGQHPAGTVLELDPAALRKVVAPSPHYAGLPEVITLAERLGVVFPSELRILAMEVANPYEVCERFSPEVESGLPELVARIRSVFCDLGVPLRAAA